MFEQATENSIHKTSNDYIKDLKERMMKTSEIVKQHNDKAREKQKRNFDTKAKAAKLEVGDFCLVQVLILKGNIK